MTVRRRRPARPGVRSNFVLATAACAVAACGGEPREARMVDVLYAGSLSALMQETLGPAFADRTGIAFRGEPAGSVAGARMIADGIRAPDVYVSADPATFPLLGPAWEGWAITFARGELTIGYTERSRFRPALDSAAAGRIAWYEVLARPGFRFGRTDPELDPKGYRTLWMFELASRAYGVPAVVAGLPRGGSREGVFPEGHLATRLEAGQLDAGAFYLSEARGHGFRTIRLPAEIHQGDPRLASLYGELRYRARSGGEIRGSPIVYCATIPAGARSRRAAERFLAYLTGREGGRLLARAGYPPYEMLLGDSSRAPPALRGRLREEGR